MNQPHKILFLTLLTASTALLEARISNIKYGVPTSDAAAGKPLMDPTASTPVYLDATGPQTHSALGLTFLNTSDNTLVVAENNDTTDDRALMNARVEGNAIKLTSMVGGTRSEQANALGVNVAAAIPNLNDKIFTKGAGSSQKTVLAVDSSPGERHSLLIVDNASPYNFIQASVCDGNATLTRGNIDDFIICGDKIVTGIFQNGQIAYGTNANGRIRVLNMEGAQVGVGKNPDGTTDLVMNTAGLNANLHVSDNYVSAISGMHWDSEMQRLFLTFASNSNSPTGLTIRPFLVGRFNGNDIILEQLSPNIVADSLANNSITVFNNKFTTNRTYSIPYVRTMHSKGTKNDGTSFDRPYLIAQVKFRHSTNLGRKVFAIPLVPNSTAENNVGKAANINNPTSGIPAASFAELYPQPILDALGNELTVSDIRALVGGAPVPVTDYDQISKMEVVGTTVLVSTISDGTGNTANEIGVWASTAILDKNGFVQGWTCWNRVAGLHERVFRIHFNPVTNQLWTVHGHEKAPNPENYNFAGISIPTFGDGLYAPTTDGTTPAGLNGWETSGFGVIRKLATEALGTIFTSRSFMASRTPGLSGSSLVTFGGTDKIFVAYTNEVVNLKENFIKYQPISNYNIANDAFAVHPAVPAWTKSRALDVVGVGQVYAIEVTRSRIANEGWMFVGGENGLWVVSKDSTGLGAWNSVGSTTGLFNNLATSVAASGTTFKKLDGISGPVIGLAAINQQDNTSQSSGTTNKLLVLTKTGLFRFDLVANKFTLTTPATLAVEEIPLGLETNEYCLSLHMLSHHANNLDAGTQEATSGILVTTKGVYVLNNLHNALGTVIALKKPIKFNDTDISKEIRYAQILPRAQFSDNTQVDDIVAVGSQCIANLLLVTGTPSTPASEIFVVPLIGTQFTSFNISMGCQTSYRINYAEDLVPVQLASSYDLEQRTLFGASALGWPMTATSAQRVNGTYTSAHLDMLGGGQITECADMSFRTMLACAGGSGGVILTDQRDGKMLVQE